MIKIINLSKVYDNHIVLKDINLTISKGEIHGLLGASGAGKSTLLRCINGLESYTTGSLIVNNSEVKTINKGQTLRHFRRKIGMIFQDFALLERLTALENVMLPMKCWNIPLSEAKKKAHDLLEMVGIADKYAHKPRELSGGQKQRVAIARTLALEPEILLCDEATSALDPVTTESILELLTQINQQLGITILVVTHQMAVAKFICDKISILENGTIVVTDNVDTLFTQEPPALRRLIGEKPLTAPNDKTIFKISLNNHQAEQPILSQLAINLNLDFSVINTRTDTCKLGKISHFYIAIDHQAQQQLATYLASKQIQFTVIKSY